jgi:nitrite reductase/ring-hydroxylating ferredoxin subunit
MARFRRRHLLELPESAPIGLGANMSWERLVSVADVEVKPRVVRSGSRQLAVFKANGDVFAIDNRCPHEGWPKVPWTTTAF